MKSGISLRLRLALVFFFALVPNAAQAWNTPVIGRSGGSHTKYTWTGADFANNLNWSNPANWCGTYREGVCTGASAAPSAGDAVSFDSGCGAHCNVTVDTDVTIDALTMMSDYTGTITQGGSNVTIKGSTGDGYTQMGGTFQAGAGTFTVGSTVGQRFVFAGGTFIGGAGAIAIGATTSTDVATFSGGSFTASSTTTTINGAADFRGLTSFSHNGGLFVFSTATSLTSGHWFTGTSAIFNDVKFVAPTTSNVSMNSTTLVMDGNLTLSGAVLSKVSYVDGTVELRQGSVTRSGAAFTGNLVTKFTGTGLQTIDMTGSTSSAYPGIWAAQSAVTGSLKFIGPEINLAGGFLTSGDMGTIDLNSALFTFSDYNPEGNAYDTQGYVVFPTLNISANNLRLDFGLVKVLGDLVVKSTGGSANETNTTGVIEVGGNYVLAAGATHFHSITTVKMNGTGAQVIDTSASTDPALSSIEIDKPSGTLSFNGTPVFFGNFKYDQGTVTMPADAVFGYSTWTLGTSVRSHGLVWNNVEWARRSTSANSWTLSDPLKVSGDFTMNNPNASVTRAYGTIELSGNLLSTANASGLSSAFAEDSSIIFEGATQAVDLTASTTAPSNTGPCELPSVVVQSTGTLTGLGTFKTKQYTHSSGAADWTGATMRFYGYNSLLTPGADVFGDVIVDGITFTLSGTMTVKGDLSFITTVAGREARGGVFDVSGDLSFSNVGHGGTSAFKLSGNSSTLARSSTNMPSGTITVAKNAGQTVTLASNFALNGGQSVSVASGAIDIGSALNTLAISGGGSLTLSGGTSVKLSGGAVTVNGSALPTGPYSGGTIVP